MPASGERSTILAEGIAALKWLSAGEARSMALLGVATEAMALMRDMHQEAGHADDAAVAASSHALLLWELAELPDGPAAGFTAARALATAQVSQSMAISAADSGGITKENLSAYVLGLRVAGLAGLALGETLAGTTARQMLTEAGSAFAEAAGGYRRLGDQENASWAELKAVEARGRAALLDM